MTNAPDMWIIYCKTCEEEREALKGESYDYICTVCGRCYDAEDVVAFNPAIAEYYKREFYGAKKAGMIPDPEFEGDREQMRRERLEW